MKAIKYTYSLVILSFKPVLNTTLGQLQVSNIIQSLAQSLVLQEQRPLNQDFVLRTLTWSVTPLMETSPVTGQRLRERPGPRPGEDAEHGTRDLYPQKPNRSRHTSQTTSKKTKVSCCRCDLTGDGGWSRGGGATTGCVCGGVILRIVNTWIDHH